MPSGFHIARDEWDHRLGRLSTAARNWRLTAMSLLLFAFLEAAALFYLGTRSKYVPFLVQVDRIGQTLPLGPATELKEPGIEVYRHHLGKTLQNVRSVYTDANAQNQAILEGFAYLAGDARSRVSDYLRQKNPFEIANRSSVSVEVNSVLKLAKDTWQIQWTETERPVFGGVAKTTDWRAVVTTFRSTPKTADAILLNPIGIYVKTLDWSRLN
jgi:type IV secretion system protein TrbF